MKKILILSDSLAAGRIGEGGDQDLKYEETWPELLKAMLPECIIARLSIGHASIKDIEKQLKYWKTFEPDIVIYQVGLNDCLPRITHRYELEFLEKYTLIGKYLQKLFNKYNMKLRKYRNITYLNENEFKYFATILYNYFQKCFFIEIIYNENRNNNHFPLCYKKIIYQYNEILKNISNDNFVSIHKTLNKNSENFTNDTFHLKEKGHLVLANSVKSMVQ